MRRAGRKLGQSNSLAKHRGASMDRADGRCTLKTATADTTGRPAVMGRLRKLTHQLGRSDHSPPRLSVVGQLEPVVAELPMFAPAELRPLVAAKPKIGGVQRYVNTDIAIHRAISASSTLTQQASGLRARMWRASQPVELPWSRSRLNSKLKPDCRRQTSCTHPPNTNLQEKQTPKNRGMHGPGIQCLNECRDVRSMLLV